MSRHSRALLTTMRASLVFVALLASCSALGGCFFYDSTWGQAKASQKRVAAHWTPSQLRSATAREADSKAGDGPPAHVEHLRIRAYATPHYAAALVDGRAQFEQALSDANPTLAHDLAFQLELADYRVWSSNLGDDDLGQLLDAVAKDDPAADVDWVVILASPRNMVAVSPDQLGVGRLISRHLAIRAMSDAAEFDVIERGFTELSAGEKAKLYAARKRHKAAAVLLHELGHTLGLPHELDQHSMMSAQYDAQSSAFSRYASRLGQRVLQLRSATPGSELQHSSAQAALNVLKSAPAHTWEATTAQQVERLLALQVSFANATASSPAQAAGPNSSAVPARPVRPSAAPASPVADLPAPDRALFAKAQAAQAASRFVDARALATPLFGAYPNVYAVQELRCQLAMKVGLSMDDESAECEPLRRLSGSAF